MPRKISTGITGGPVLGTLSTINTTISPNIDNQNLVLDPRGTGETHIVGDLDMTNGASIKFSDDSGSNSVGLTAPSSLAGNVNLTLPGTSGTNGQVIQVNSSGELSFVDVQFPVTDNTVSATVHYPMLTTNTSGSESEIVTSSSKLEFQPSTGTLTADNFSGNGSGLNNVSATDISVSEDSSTSGSFYPTFVSGTSGTRSIESDNSMTYNPSTGEFTATIVTASSDQTLKTEITTLENALSKVSALRGVNFLRKRTNQRETGLIAQEVEKVVPEVVTTDQNGLKSIAYGNLVGLLIEAIKEQEIRINKFEEQIYANPIKK